MRLTEYACVDDAWLAVLAHLVDQPRSGSRDGDAREEIGTAFKLVDPSRCWLMNERRALSPRYAAAEILWYASGDPSVEMISRYSPQYARFAESNGRAYGAYGERLLVVADLVAEAIKALRGRTDTRRAVVSLWRWSDIVDGHGVGAVKDVPCTLTWQFLARDGRLHMIVSMRSNDAWMGMPYDVFWNCTVMRCVACEIGLRLGTYTHLVGSMHLYERHASAAEQALGVAYDVSRESRAWLQADESCGFDSLRVAARVERAYARNGTTSETATGTIASSLLTLCKHHRDPGDGVVHDDCLRDAERVYAYSRTNTVQPHTGLARGRSG